MPLDTFTQKGLRDSLMHLSAAQSRLKDRLVHLEDVAARTELELRDVQGMLAANEFVLDVIREMLQQAEAKGESDANEVNEEARSEDGTDAPT